MSTQYGFISIKSLQPAAKPANSRARILKIYPEVNFAVFMNMLVVIEPSKMVCIRKTFCLLLIYISCNHRDDPACVKSLSKWRHAQTRRWFCGGE